MMGFLGKLGLLVLVVAVVWAVTRGLARPAPEAKRAPGRRSQATAGVEDMRACTRCGTYVPARGAQACDRRDCPLLPGV